MQRTACLTFLGLLTIAASAAASPLAFRAPGEFDASWFGSQEVSWALLVFKNGTAADFEAASPLDARLLNETHTHPLQLQRDDDSATPHTLYEESEQVLPGPFKLKASFPTDRQSSLFVVAKRIELDLHDAHGILDVKSAGDSLQAFSRQDDRLADLYRGHDPGASVVLAAKPLSHWGGTRFTFMAENASSVEWYNAAVDCKKAAPCPTGGGPEILELPAPSGYSATSERHTYEIIEGNRVRLSGQGSLDYVVFGATHLTVGLQGTLRLPLASAAGESCPSCILPDNQTFSATGNITLTNLRISPGGDLEADAGGDLTTAYFDEILVDPESIFGGTMAVGAVAAVGGFFLLKWFLWPLFTRRSDKDLLDNDRRRHLYEFVVKNPGVHFREALRGVGIPSGSGRHHIIHLVRAGLLVERRVGSKLRLFEGGRPLRDGWQDMAALRNPKMRLLHDWILENPERSQKEILAAFRELHGWNASTTQGRLARLVKDGIVRAKAKGRRKHYAVAKAAGFQVAETPALDSVPA